MWPFNGGNGKRNGKKLISSGIPSEDPTSLGNLMISEGLLTYEQLQLLLDEFHRTTVDELIGEFSVSRGVMTEAQLEVLLLKQRQLRGDSIAHEDIMKLIHSADTAQDRVSTEATALLQLMTKATR